MPPEMFINLCQEQQAAAMGCILVLPKLPKCFEENSIFIDGRKNKEAFRQATNFLQKGYQRINEQRRNCTNAKPNKIRKGEEGSNYGVIIAEIEAEHLKEVTGMNNPSVLKNVIIDLNAEEFCVYSEITISNGNNDVNQKLFKDHNDRLETLGSFFKQYRLNQKVTMKLNVRGKPTENLQNKFRELFEQKCNKYGMILEANRKDETRTGTNMNERHGMRSDVSRNDTQTHAQFKHCVEKLVQLCKPFEEEFKMQEIRLERIEEGEPEGDDSDRLVKFVDDQLSSLSKGTCFLTDVQDIFQEAALLDATKSGTMDAHKETTKIAGEVQKFQKLIEEIKKDICCGASTRRVFVRNTTQTKLQHFVKASQSLRFEFDWIFVSHDLLIFIDITSGKKEEVGKKLDQIKSQYIRTREMCWAIVAEWRKRYGIDELPNWMRELDEKYAKHLIITPEISNDLWSEKMKTVKSKLKNVKSLEFLYVASKEVCESIQTKNLMTFTKGRDGEVFALTESQITLRQLLTLEQDDSDSEYKRLAKYIGSIILAAHMTHFHRGPQDHVKYLVPGRFREPSKQQMEIDNEITQHFKEGTGSRTIILGESGSGKTFFCLYMADKCIQELKFTKVFYTLPESKTHLREMVKTCLKRDYKYAEGDDRMIVCTMEKIKTCFPDKIDMDHNYALIIDECLASNKENLSVFLKPVSCLFPYCQVVLVSQSVLGQMSCAIKGFDHNTLQGFQRRVLTVGYRSTRNIAQFNSTLLHANTKKLVCGTSTCVFAPTYWGDKEVELEVISDDTKAIQENVESWIKICQQKNLLVPEEWTRGIFVFQDDSAVTPALNVEGNKLNSDVFEIIRWEDNLTSLEFSGCEISNVLILLLTKKKILRKDTGEACLLLAATTRARRSLRILVTNPDLGKFLKDQKDTQNLLLKDSVDGDGKTMFEIWSLRECYEKLRETFSNLIARGENQKLIESVPKTFRTLLTKRKGDQFLRKVMELFEEKDFGRYLTIQDLIEWLRTGFERGYIETIEIFSEFLKKEVKKKMEALPEEEKRELLESKENVLYWACFNGNPQVVGYVLEKVLEPILGMEQKSIKLVITQQEYFTNCEEREKTKEEDSRQSLLGIIAEQNRSPDVFLMLLGQLEIEAETIGDEEMTRTSNAIREAFRWTIKYHSIRFLKGVLRPGVKFAGLVESLKPHLKEAFQRNCEERKQRFLASLEQAGSRFDVVTANYLTSEPR